MGLWGFTLTLAASAVGAAARERHELGSAVRDVNRRISELKIPGVGRHAGLASGRRMVVQSMLAGLEVEEHMQPYQTEILTNVSELLQGILEDFLYEADQDSDMMNTSMHRILQCEVDYNTLVGTTLEAQLNESEANHTSCRADEETLFDNDATLCAAVVTFLTSLPVVDCNFRTVSLANINDWNVWFQDGVDWFTTQFNAYVPLRDACKNATVLLENQIVVCNADQVTFENHVCEWHLHKIGMCVHYEDCYETRVNETETLIARVLVDSARRMAEAMSITYIRCLVDNLIIDVIDFNGCDSALSGDYSDYNATYPAIPAAPVCYNQIDWEYPGTTNWYTSRYSGISTKTPPLENSGVVCFNRF